MSYIIYVAILVFLSPAAFAGPCAMQCQQKANKEKSACEAKAAQVKAADASRSAASSAANKNPNQHTSSSSMVNDTAAQKADTQNAANQCKANEEKCKSECDEEKGKIPKNKACTGDEGQIENTKSSICGMIAAMAGELQQGANNMGNDNQASNNTKGNTGGMPMPLPIPIPGKKDDKPADDPLGTNKPLDCNMAENSRYSDCNDTFINKCSGNMGQTGCDTFINRYCGSMNGSTSNDTTPTNPINNFSVSSANPYANLVTDKQGEGMGSAFCGKANGYRFCQTSGREQCPSCQNISNWSTAMSPDELKSAQNTCPSDPMFSDPAVAAQIGTTPPPNPVANGESGINNFSVQSRTGIAAVGAGSGTTASGSGVHGGAGSNAGSFSGEGGISEGSPLGSGSLDLNSGSGVSGGHGGDSESSSSTSRYGTQSTAAGAANQARTVASGTTDVAHQYGPNIFSISTTTYRALCTRGKLLHCRER